MSDYHAVSIKPCTYTNVHVHVHGYTIEIMDQLEDPQVPIENKEILFEDLELVSNWSSAPS